MCETVVSRLVPGPVRHQRAVGYAILRESDPAGGHAFAEAAILVVDGAGERSEIAQRPENIGNFGAMPGAARRLGGPEIGERGRRRHAHGEDYAGFVAVSAD